MSITYEKAQEIFATARSPDRGKPLENNTRLFKRGEDFAVRLHNTDVVTIHPDGAYTLRTDGWQTVTTKARICSYSPARLYSDQGVWYISVDKKAHATSSWEWDKQLRALFEEGIKIDALGYPLDFDPRKTAAFEKKRKLMRKAVTQYIKDFVQHFVGKGFPLDKETGMFQLSGDCFTCQAMPAEKLGAAKLDLHHIAAHIDESYFVPTLYFRVLQWRRRGDYHSSTYDPNRVFSMTHHTLLKNPHEYQGRYKKPIHHDLEWFFRPLINELTREASSSYPQILVRQMRREQQKQKQRRKVKAKV